MAGPRERRSGSGRGTRLTRQSARAAFMRGSYLLSGERTCIDCHKGIAHQLPDMGVALRSP